MIPFLKICYSEPVLDFVEPLNFVVSLAGLKGKFTQMLKTIFMFSFSVLCQNLPYGRPSHLINEICTIT
jgi:hypothetical protein